MDDACSREVSEPTGLVQGYLKQVCADVWVLLSIPARQQIVYDLLDQPNLARVWFGI